MPRRPERRNTGSPRVPSALRRKIFRHEPEATRDIEFGRGADPKGLPHIANSLYRELVVVAGAGLIEAR